jgi:hypothetical protein
MQLVLKHYQSQKPEQQAQRAMPQPSGGDRAKTTQCKPNQVITLDLLINIANTIHSQHTNTHRHQHTAHSVIHTQHTNTNERNHNTTTQTNASPRIEVHTQAAIHRHVTHKDAVSTRRTNRGEHARGTIHTRVNCLFDVVPCGENE